MSKGNDGQIMPGNPNIIVKLLLGARSLKLANYLPNFAYRNSTDQAPLREGRGGEGRVWNGARRRGPSLRSGPSDSESVVILTREINSTGSDTFKSLTMQPANF